MLTLCTYHNHSETQGKISTRFYSQSKTPCPSTWQRSHRAPFGILLPQEQISDLPLDTVGCRAPEASITLPQWAEQSPVQHPHHVIWGESNSSTVVGFLIPPPSFLYCLSSIRTLQGSSLLMAGVVHETKLDSEAAEVKYHPFKKIIKGHGKSY